MNSVKSQFYLLYIKHKHVILFQLLLKMFSYCAADLRLCFRICKSRFFHDAAQIMYDVFICNTTKLRNIVHSLGVFAVFWVATFCVFVYLALSSCRGTKINLLFGSHDESKMKAITRNRCNQNQNPALNKEKEYKTRRWQAKTKMKYHV